MPQAVKMEALIRLNNSKLRVLKEIAERTENGAKFIHFNDLASELDCSRHVVHDAVQKLIDAKLIFAEPAENPGERGKIGIKPDVIVNFT